MIVSWGAAIALVGAGIGAGLASVGSAIGVGIAGEAAAGVQREKPELGAMALIMQALPGTQGFYGFVAMFLGIAKISNNLGTLDITTGLAIFAAFIPVMVAELMSGVWQGKASAAALQMLARRQELAGRAIIIPAIVETYALVGLLATIIMLNQIRI